jgi:hypothetical protein
MQTTGSPKANSLNLHRRALLAGLGAFCAGPVLAASSTGRTLWSTGPVAIEFYRENQIYLPALVAGRPTSILLDSGAERLILDTAFARAAGVPFRGSITGHAVQGSTKGHRIARPVAVETDAFRLDVKRPFAFDLSGIAAAAGRPVEAVIGRDVFDAFLVDLDISGRKATFLESGSPRPPGQFESLPLPRSGDLRAMFVRVGGAPPVEATFDLGNTGTLIVSPQWAAANRLLENRRTTTSGSVGIDGARIDTEFVAPAIQIGSVTFRDVPITVAAQWSASKRAQANIGLGLLQRYRMVIDHARDRLHLAPEPEHQRAFRKNRSGLRARFAGDRLRVIHVSRGGPAERSGWKVGEEIVAIDGVPITSDFPNLPVSFWGSGEAGSQMTLTMAGGEMRKLVLEDYF